MSQADLTKTVRYGIESVRGTGVTCTDILDVADADWDIIPPKIRSGNLTGGVFASSSVTPGVLVPRVRVKLASVNWDKLQRYIAGSINGAITASGAGANKTWTDAKPPALSTGAALTEALKSFTLEFGYANPTAANPAHKITGALIDRIKLTWPRSGFVSAELDFVSISAVTDLTAYSGTLSPNTVAASPATGTAGSFLVYADDTTLGTTQDTTVVSAEWEWRSFMAPDENGLRLGIARAADWSLTIDRFWDAADMLANARTGAEKKFRVKSVGPALAAATYALTVDCYGWADERTPSALSGFVGETVKIVPKLDATAASDVAVGIVNAVATL